MKKKNIKILLVDDELDFVSTLAERLRLRGYQADVATDGDEALEIFTTRSFDIVILDVVMPGMSGLDVLKEIREKKSDTPVILLTGHGSAEEGIEGKRMGAFDYLMKPINIEELIEKIGTAVKNN